MNWLETAIASISPEAGARRAAARIRLSAMNSYEGARRSRRTEGWNAKSDSANRSLQYDIETLRDRARDLVRNSPYGEKAVSALSSYMVGTGITPRIRIDENAAIDAPSSLRNLWQEFCNQCDFDGHTDFYGLQNLAARTLVESGEVLIVYRPAKLASGLTIPLQLQVLEPDFLDHRKNVRELPDGGFIVQGIQFNKAGKRAGYWLFDRHPGDGQRTESKLMPASEILHLYRKKRPGQERGGSWFAPVMMRLRDLADYDEAELMAKKIAACFALVVTQTGDTTIGPGRRESGTGKMLESIEPGMIANLSPGESVTSITPEHSQHYPAFVNKHLHDTAAGLLLTYEILTGDMSQVNYTSFRAGQIDFRQVMDQLRWHLWVPGLCAPVWSRFAALAEVVSDVKDVPRSVEWSPPRYLSVDPGKDYKAVQTAVRSGFMSQMQATAEFGEDWQTVVSETEQMNVLMDEKKITWDSDARKRTLSGTNQQDMESIKE